MSDTNDRRVAALVSDLSLEEKAAQVACAFYPTGKVEIRPGGWGGVAWPETSMHHPPPVGAANRNELQRDVMASSRHGIPAITNEEALNGLKVAQASVLPDAIGQAATWDPELVEEMAGVIGRQMATIGVHQALAPLCDVARDPRWGRIEETYGEDPYLVGCTAAAFVRGMQQAAAGRQVATLKHFVAYSGSDGGRNLHPSPVGPRALREVHGLGFEMAIRLGGARGIMASYQAIDGVPVQSDRSLLTDLLRDEYGFTGIVISDLGSVEQLQTHHSTTLDRVASLAESLRAGLDLELAGPPATDEVVRAVRSGQLAEQDLDRAVATVLRMKLELGLFDDPFVDEAAVPDVLDTEADRAVARRVAERSLTLLRNEPVDGAPLLPIGPAVRTIALVGPNADRTLGLLGNYSFPVLDSAVQRMTDLMDPSKRDGPPPEGFQDLFSPGGRGYADDVVQTVETVPVVTILEGLRARAPEGLEVRHARGCGVEDPDPSGIAEAVALAAGADLAVVVVGDQSGIGSGATVGESVDSVTCALPGVQRRLVEEVAATGTPTAVVLTHGRPFVLDWMVDAVPAILSAWFPGEEGGHAVAAGLFGDVDPAGRTPVTFLRHAGLAPMPYDRAEGGTGTYHDLRDTTPVFPFGHGLSYTTFSYSDLLVSAEEVPTDGTVDLTCTVTNTGDREGDEVVQLYRRDPVARVTRPRRSLTGFRRITLAPGASAEVTFHVHAERSALWDATEGWIVEPGDLQLLVGSSSEDVRLRTTVRLTGEVHRCGTGRVLDTPVTVAPR